MINNKKQSIKEIVDYYLKENPVDAHIKSTNAVMLNKEDKLNREYYNKALKNGSYIDKFQIFDIYQCKNGEKITDYFLDPEKEFVAAFVTYKNIRNGSTMVEDTIYKCDKYPSLYMTDIYLQHYMKKYNYIESSDCFFDDGRKYWEKYLIPTALNSGFKARLIDTSSKRFYPITKDTFEKLKQQSKGSNMLYGLYK